MALAAAFVVSAMATPAGISGAVLLLPFQVSVLGTPSPAVTPTNLLYNVVSTPGDAVPVPAAALNRRAPGPAPHHRDPACRASRIGHPGRAGSRPSRLRLMVAALLLPLGIWLTATRPARNLDPDQQARPARRIPAPALIVSDRPDRKRRRIFGIGGVAIL